MNFQEMRRVAWLTAQEFLQGERRSVFYYGAKGDGVTDDTEAIQEAIDTNRSIYFPPGTYLVSTLTLSAADSLALIGAGVGDNLGATIKASSATADVIVVNAGFVEISGLNFTSSVTRTAGAFIRVNTASCVVRDFRMAGAFIGVDVRASNCTVRHGQINNCVATTGTGVFVRSNPANVRILDVSVVNASKIASGFRIEQCQDVMLVACSSLNCENGLLIAPEAAQTAASIVCTENFFDGCDRCLYITSTGGSVVRCRFTACWFGSATVVAAHIVNSGAGTFSGFQFTGCQFLISANEGLACAGSGTVEDVEVVGGAASGNTGSGLYFAGNCDGFTVSGVTSGAGQGLTANVGNGILIDLGAVNYCIVGNRVRGNTAGQITDNGGAVNKLVANNLVT